MATRNARGTGRPTSRAIGLDRVRRARQGGNPVVAQEVFDARGGALVDHAGGRGHAAAVEGAERYRRVAVAAVLAAGQQVQLQRADRAAGAGAEPSVDARAQVAERPEILLQGLGQGIGRTRPRPQHEPGLPVRAPHRPPPGPGAAPPRLTERVPSRVDRTRKVYGADEFSVNGKLRLRRLRSPNRGPPNARARCYHDTP
jgi:hypothetical protein